MARTEPSPPRRSGGTTSVSSGEGWGTARAEPGPPRRYGGTTSVSSGEGWGTARTEPGPPRRSGGTTSVSSGGGGERPGRSRALREETEGRPLCRPGKGGEAARTEPGSPRRYGGTTSVSSGEGRGSGPDGAGPSEKKLKGGERPGRSRALRVSIL